MRKMCRKGDVKKLHGRKWSVKRETGEKASFRENRCM